MNRILLLIAFLFLLKGNIQSQNAKGQKVFTANIGFMGGESYHLENLNHDSTYVHYPAGFSYAQKAESYSGGRWILGADLGISKRLSIGIQFSSSSYGGEITDHIYYKYIDSTQSGERIHEAFDFEANRKDLVFTPKFHLISKEKLDFYVGFKLGLRIWKASHGSKDPNFEKNEFDMNYTDMTYFGRNKTYLSFTLPSIGARYYFNETWGCNTEINWGGGFSMGTGVCYRIGAR